MRRLTFTVLLTCLLVLAFAIQSSAQQDMADEQAAWEALGIEVYHIAVQDASVWNWLQLDLWVQDGKVQMLRASCQPGMVGMPCNLGIIRTQQYTVGELFEQASQAGEWLARIEYDAIYHYPTLIVLDNPQAIDDEHALRVTAFEVLPAWIASPNGYGMAAALAMLTSEPLPRVTPTVSETHVVPLSPIELDGDPNIWFDNAEARWNALGVNSYRLTLSETTPLNGLNLTLEVREGRPVTLEAGCHPGWMGGPCEVWSVGTHSYTIPSLLERLHAAALMDNDRVEAQSVDADTGIPVHIFYDDPNFFHEEWEILVSQVVLLEVPQ